MKKTCFAFLVLFLSWGVLPLHCWSSGVGTDSSLVEVESSEKHQIVSRLSSLQSSISSISAIVTQERHLSVLKKKIVVTGTIMLLKPNRLRWNANAPHKTITVFDGETMIVYHPDLKEAQVYNISEDMVARNTSNFLVSVFNSKSVNEIEKKFSLRVFKDTNQYVFSMSPLSSVVRRYINNITVFYNSATGLPKGFDMTTPKGDRTITRFSEIKTNIPIAPEMFKIKLTDDVWITNQVELTDH